MPITRLGPWGLVSLVVCVGLVGCGSDDRPPQYVSGIEQDRPLSDLNESERVALCQSQRVFVETTVDLESVLRFACLPLGVIGFVSQDLCQTALDACMLVSTLQVGAWVTPSCDARAPLVGCEASVRDVEACLNLRTHARLRVGALTCDPTAEPIVQEAMQVEQQAACVRVTQRCPDALEDIEGPQ